MPVLAFAAQWLTINKAQSQFLVAPKRSQQQEAPLLLSHELSRVPLWDGTWKDRIQRGKDLAVTIIPNADVERWRASGYTVRRGCYTKYGNPLFEVQIVGPKGFKHIFLTHTEGALVGTVGGQNLNGSTPATAQELVKLIDQLVE